jgi:hypothetical protein
MVGMKWLRLAPALGLTAVATSTAPTLEPPPVRPVTSITGSPTALHSPSVEASNVVPSVLVMSSRGYTLENGKLVLEGVSATTVVFAEGPERLAGHVPTASLIRDWLQGTSSFANTPPHAEFSTFGAEGTTSAVVALEKPSLRGDRLTYDVRVLEGNVPASGAEGSLFIDVGGMSPAPRSFSSLARRTALRAVFFGY